MNADVYTCICHSEDDDENRDLIEDDCQLQPDIETLEQFTVEVVHLRDDVPVPSDAIGQEDFDRPT